MQTRQLTWPQANVADCVQVVAQAAAVASLVAAVLGVVAAAAAVGLTQCACGHLCMLPCLQVLMLSGYAVVVLYS